MSDAISTLANLPVTSSVSSASAQTAAESTDSAAAFQQVLMTMLLSNSTSSLTSSSSSSSGMGDMLTPLLMLLLEQMISSSVETESSSATTQSSQTGQVSTLSTRPTPAGRPVGGTITQGYTGSHNGIDFGVVVGTEVKSTMAGEVVYAGWNDQGYGNLVIVENGGYRTYYAHLSSIPVQVGDQVLAGNTIGLSGNTGNSTGPHLHYEIRYNMQCIDPTDLTFNTVSA